jgi:hypothetical protein
MSLKGQVWWHIPIIPAIQEAETRRLWLEATSLGKVSRIPYLENKLKAKELGIWLMWESACLATWRPRVQKYSHYCKSERNDLSEDLKM